MFSWAALPSATFRRCSRSDTLSVSEHPSATRAVLPAAARAARRIGGVSPIVICPRVVSKNAWICSKRSSVVFAAGLLIAGLGCQRLRDLRRLLQLLGKIPRQPPPDAGERLV